MGQTDIREIAALSSEEGKTQIEERRIVLIDNYIDDTVLTLMSKRASEVKATIYTGKISKQLQLDIDKHNAQYPPIEVRTFSKAHERRRRMWGRCPIRSGMTGARTGMTGRGGQTGPSRSFMSVSVRDGTRKRCPEGENGTVTQSFGQKVA